MKQTENKITIVSNRKCRKSDVVVRFLAKENILHQVLYLGEDTEGV